MRTRKYRLVALLFPLCLAALLCCGDDTKNADTDASVPPSSPVEAGTIPVDGATPPDGGRLTSCVDRPTDIPRPPTGRLPCELIPPGVSL